MSKRVTLTFLAKQVITTIRRARETERRLRELERRVGYRARVGFKAEAADGSGPDVVPGGGFSQDPDTDDCDRMSAKPKTLIWW